MKMEKRTYKKTGQEVSLLGFGMMRLPRVDPDKADIDYTRAQEMVDYAMAHGVNYFDTAYPYHEGKSEPFTGYALAQYARDSYYIATKMPSWTLESAEDAPRIFAEQLTRLKTDYIDFYLCHGLGKSLDEYKKRYEETGAMAYLEEQKKKGAIKNLGFSFHGESPVLEELLDYKDWDFVQIQLNYLDWDNQNAKRLNEILESRGIPAIIMEPVRGGTLATLTEQSVSILKEADPERSVASWAMRFASSLPNVLTVLSGMTTMEQLEDNVKTLENFVPLKDRDYKVLQEALAVYLDAGTIPCTGCRYCMDCPSGVDIPRVFDIYNKCAAEKKLPVSFGDEKEFKENAVYFESAYNALAEDNRAHNCVDCQVCVEHCPQEIKIPERLRGIARIAEGLAI